MSTANKTVPLLSENFTSGKKKKKKKKTLKDNSPERLVFTSA